MKRINNGKNSMVDGVKPMKVTEFILKDNFISINIGNFTREKEDFAMPCIVAMSSESLSFHD